MPRVKLIRDWDPEATKNDDRLKRKVEMFRTYRNLRGFISWEQIAPKLGMSNSAFYRSLRAPEKMTDKFQHDLIRALNIPDSDIRPYL